MPNRIEIRQDNMVVNAKSIMGMMTLGLVQGQKLEIDVEGNLSVNGISHLL